MSRRSNRPSGQRKNAKISLNAPRFDAWVLREPDPKRRLLLKLQILTADWRHCARGACRRRRGCASPAGCVAPQPECTMTPEQDAQMRADLLRMIGERLATLRAVPTGDAN